MDSTAVSRVLATAELLEMILVQLSTSDGAQSFWYAREQVADNIMQLFSAQRVNVFFRNTIRGSMKLRRLMWLEQDPSVQEPETTGAHHLSNTNPIVESFFFGTTKEM